MELEDVDSSADFSVLIADWTRWSSLAGLSNVGTSTGPDDCAAAFTSDDESFYLRQADRWWMLDEVDERGQRYERTAQFSTLGLAEKYLVWRWASTARSVLGVPQLGGSLQSLGTKPGVSVVSIDRESVAELRLMNGIAIIPASQVPVFSHVLSMSLAEINQLLGQNVGHA